MCAVHKGMDTLKANLRTRIREDSGYIQARDHRSMTPYAYTMTDGFQPGCKIIPNTDDYAQCNKTWGSDNPNVSNYLRFGEKFTTYEPGHAVSTELKQHSFYAGRGEGIVKKGLVDLESSLKLPSVANAEDVRGREALREVDVTARRFPPNLGPSVPQGCPRIYERVVVESMGPRGGRPTRVDVRNASSLR